MLKFDYKKADWKIRENEMEYMKNCVRMAHNLLEEKTGAGNDFLGWVDLPADYDKQEFDRIKKAAQKIQNNSDVLIVIGIGGSYLGAKAAVSMLGHSFHNAMPKQVRKTPSVFFAGNSISSTYLADLLELIDGRDFSVNVISKSGTTTEPAVAFRIFRELLEEKYGKEGARERIFATTDQKRGALKKLADEARNLS